LLIMFFSAALAAAQAAPAPAPQSQPVRIRAGDYAPGSRDAVPISEVAQPMALAVAGFDTDNDGITSRAEFDAGLGRTFAAADANGDGQLGYIEYAAWARTWMGSETALPGPFAIDRDGDDRLARAEMLSEFGRQFERLDANRDAALARAELLTVRNPVRQLQERDLRRLQRQPRRP
jgi:hypothetical protein